MSRNFITEYLLSPPLFPSVWFGPLVSWRCSEASLLKAVGRVCLSSLKQCFVVFHSQPCFKAALEVRGQKTMTLSALSHHFIALKNEKQTSVREKNRPHMREVHTAVCTLYNFEAL